MNIDWNDPELYFSLALLAGSTALVLIVHEFRRRKPGWWQRAQPLDGLLRDRSRPTKRPKPVALLAVAALAFAVLAWHVARDYVLPPAFTSHSPTVRGNWLRVSLRRVRLQRRARLARPKWSVRVTL